MLVEVGEVAVLDGVRHERRGLEPPASQLPLPVRTRRVPVRQLEHLVVGVFGRRVRVAVHREQLPVPDEGFARDGRQKVGQVQVGARELDRLVGLDPPVVDELEALQVNDLELSENTMRFILKKSRVGVTKTGGNLQICSFFVAGWWVAHFGQ